MPAEASPDATVNRVGDCLASGEGFPVVGIGASAGGLAAFEAFFSGMPSDTDTGMAFVLVQHLAPDHKSILTDLIGRYTRMQVFEVEDGMAVRPDCAYIIPPNRDMAFLNGTLQLFEPKSPRGQRLPIDFFFRSLAQDQHERAICIVLSGTGSDGILGLRAIKGEGGMAMAQAPESAEYDGMPLSAIATGLVDYTLPPGEMAAQLVSYVAHAFGTPSRPMGHVPPAAENALKKIFVLLRERTGHDFSQYKSSTIHRRIERRMAVHQIETLSAYVRYLQENLCEVDALFRDLLIGVTGFFRDKEAFKVLEEQVIPKLFEARPVGGTIRVWVPGCSTGEEAYSIAILLAEHQEALKRNYALQVFATDIDASAIATARTGLYPASINADVSPERLARFFAVEPGGTAFRIHKSVRDLLVFSEQDVLKDPPFSKLDLIGCRNLLIYFSGDLQKKLIPLFHYALNPGGVLFLGTSETVGEHGELFTVIDRRAKLYRRKEGPCSGPVFKMIPPSPLKLDATPSPRVRKAARVSGKSSLQELAERAVLEQVAPVAALVNAHGDILYLHGRSGLYLEPAPGEAGVNNILKMARDGLRQELTLALHKAVSDHKTVRNSTVRVKTNGDWTVADLTVTPATPEGSQDFETPLFAVILGQTPPGGVAVPAWTDASQPDTDAEARVVALQQELRTKEEYLQSSNEELETANEELKSSNEEMQSVNEELQSTNEELETSKEELQSVNEELATVNAELQTKVADLTRINNDMNNLLAGTNIATIFVDHGLRVMRFTPAATGIINLIHSDIGRPVNHIVTNLEGYDTLASDIRTVLDTLIPKEAETHTPDGRWYLMRIQPYRTLENVIEGAVLTFVDISERKRAEEALLESERRLREAQHIAGIGNWEWNLRSGQTHWSPEIYAMHGLSPGDPTFTPGELLRHVHPDDVEKVKAVITNAISEGTMADLQYRTIRPDGSIRVIHAVGAVTEFDAERKPLVMVGTNQDVTDRKRSEETIRAQFAEIKSYYDNVPIGLAVLDMDLRFVRINKTLAGINGMPVEAHIGKTVDEIVPALAPLARRITAEIIATGNAKTGIVFQGETPALPGVTVTWEEGWYPLKNDAGEVTGFSVIVEETHAKEG